MSDVAALAVLFGCPERKRDIDKKKLATMVSFATKVENNYSDRENNVIQKGSEFYYVLEDESKDFFFVKVLNNIFESAK